MGFDTLPHFIVEGFCRSHEQHLFAGSCGEFLCKAALAAAGAAG